MNKWMNDPQYLAQFGHTLGGFVVIFAARVFFGAFGMWIGLILGLILVVGKEFWYDMKYELPAQTWWASIMDFIFYVLGAGIGYGLANLAVHFHRIQ
jgi:hypothetical protein